MNDNVIVRTNCPSCNNESFDEIYQLDLMAREMLSYLKNFYDPQGGVEIQLLKGWKYILCKCKCCELIFQKEILNDHLMEKLYEHWLDPAIQLSDSKRHNVAYYSNLSEEIKQVIDYFGRHPSELKFLDFGMGWGEWCKMAKAYGCSVAGVELSVTRNRYAQENAISTIEPNELPNHQFDFINTEQVFEHIPNPLTTLQSLKKSLAPGGLIKISVPDGVHARKVLRRNEWSAPKGTKNSMNIVAPLEHINCFNHQSLKTMAELAGLYIEKKLAYSKYPETLLDLIKNRYRGLYINLFRADKGTYLFLKKRAEN